LLQLLFWQVLFVDIGKIYRVIDASTGHQIESLSGSIFGVTLIRVAVRIVRFNRNDIMQRQPTPFIADGCPRKLGLVENLFAHRALFSPRKSEQDLFVSFAVLVG
jgi:hypothetical protein